MLNERYRIGISETLHYLKGIRQEDIDKIPGKLMTYFKENVSSTYTCDFDYTKPLQELKLTDEAKGLIAMICLNYWCETEEQKAKFRKHLILNEQAYQKELKRKYNVDDIFKRNIIKAEEIKTENTDVLPVVVKKENSIIKRLINFIKKVLNKNI